MSRVSFVLAATAVSLLLTAGVTQAQDRAIEVWAHGGGYTPLADLNDAGTAEFSTGFNVGGGIGVQVHRYVAIRGEFTFARSDGTGGNVDGLDYNRFFYGGDVELRYPFDGGIAPYVFGGGGAVTNDPEGTTGSSFTKGAGRFGGGVRYTLSRTGLGFFVQGTSWVYEFDKNGFDKTQFDITYSGGLSYRFPL